MNEPASKEDVERLATRLGEVEKSVKGMREQNSAEHGSLFLKLTHLGNLMAWIRDAWKRFSILPEPPEETKPPKDDTQ